MNRSAIAFLATIMTCLLACSEKREPRIRSGTYVRRMEKSIATLTFVDESHVIWRPGPVDEVYAVIGDTLFLQPDTRQVGNTSTALLIRGDSLVTVGVPGLVFVRADRSGERNATEALVGTAATRGIDGIVAIAGIVGTLLGAIVGVVATWKIQQRQLAHEDRTRFHDRRLAVYAEFNDACGKVMDARVGAVPSVEDNARFIASYESLRIIATEPVVQAATVVHGIVLQDTLAPDPLASTSPFNTSMVQLANAMRQELGVQ